jgi:hypothetical protein
MPQRLVQESNSNFRFLAPSIGDRPAVHTAPPFQTFLVSLFLDTDRWTYSAAQQQQRVSPHATGECPHQRIHHRPVQVPPALPSHKQRHKPNPTRTVRQPSTMPVSSSKITVITFCHRYRSTIERAPIKH